MRVCNNCRRCPFLGLVPQCFDFTIMQYTYVDRSVTLWLLLPLNKAVQKVPFVFRLTQLWHHSQCMIMYVCMYLVLKFPVWKFCAMCWSYVSVRLQQCLWLPQQSCWWDSSQLWRQVTPAECMTQGKHCTLLWVTHDCQCSFINVYLSFLYSIINIIMNFIQWL